MYGAGTARDRSAFFNFGVCLARSMTGADPLMDPRRAGLELSSYPAKLLNNAPPPQHQAADAQFVRYVADFGSDGFAPAASAAVGPVAG